MVIVFTLSPVCFLVMLKTVKLSVIGHCLYVVSMFFLVMISKAVCDWSVSVHGLHVFSCHNK